MISELFLGNVFLWTCVWQSTVCVVAGLVGSFVFRHWPARAHRVLFVAMIAAVIVPILSSLVRYFELGVLVAEPTLVESKIADMTLPNYQEAPELMGAEDVGHMPETAREYSVAAVATQPGGLVIGWNQVALWGWGAASLILTLRLVLTFVLGVRLLGRALPLGCEKIRDAVHVARAKLGFGRNVEVYSSAGVCSPVIWCWGRRPVLFVPSAASQADERLDWISVLCHELAHWKRRDHISGLLAELMVCIFPWNPLMWWAKRRLVSLSERACDDWVVSSGRPGVDYAQSLLDLLPQGQMAFVPAVVSSEKALGARIRRILKDRCGNPRTGTLWALVVGIVAMCVAVGIAFAQTRPARAEEAKGEGAAWAKQSEQYALPAGWRLDYDDGSKSIEVGDKSNGGKGGHWRSGMAKNLAELRAVPTPTNEYDESWKDERLEFEITSLSSKRMGSIVIWGETESDRIILAPDKYVLSYTQKRQDPVSNCLIPLDSAEFVVDLRRAGMYELKFSPKLKEPKTTEDTQSLTTCAGIVVDRSGNFLDGAEVQAYEMFFDMAGSLNLRLVAKAITKTDGKFLFGTKPSVKKSRSMGGVVVAQKEGLAVGWTEWPLYGTQQVTITLGKPTKLAGFVIDENSDGVSDAEVRAVLFRKKTSEKEKTKWLPGIGPLSWLAVRTDRQGRFEFNNIPADVRADLVVLAAGFSTIYTHKPENLEKGFEGAEFKHGQKDIKITLSPEGRIEGRIVNEKTSDGLGKLTFAVVPHFSPFFFVRYVCVTEEDGSFSIGGLQAGEYLIRRDSRRYPGVNVKVESGKTTEGLIIKWPHKIQSPAVKPDGLEEVEWITINPDVRVEGGTNAVTLRLLSSDRERIVHFPKDRSLGMLKIQDADTVSRIKDFHYWIGKSDWWNPEWEYLGEAMGDVTVPAGKRLALFVSKDVWRDLSPLRQLGSNDLYMLKIPGSVSSEQFKPDDRCMPHIAGLTGLKVLDLRWTNISSKGLQYIKNFQELERLYLPERITDAGLADLAELKSLKGLYFKQNRVTDAGLAYLAKLTSLEELELGGNRIGDAGLAHLGKLKKLRYLLLWGNFSDAGMAHLRNTSSLRILQLGRLPITDAGLAHLSNLTELENLDIYNTQITDEGLVSLKSMRSLKKLNLGGTKITGKGLAHLAEIKSLEYIDLPSESVTDRGLGYLSQLSKLKHLRMPSPHYVDPDMDKRLYTDKGLEELAKLQSLEELFLAGLAVTDEGMSHVAKLANLKELHLFGCPITNQGLAKLTALKSLRRLTLYETKVSISGLSQLNSLPDLILLDATDIRQDNSILNISGLTKLENLTIGTQHKGGVIRDEDLACLAKLKRLKWFQISSVINKPMAISDAGAAHLAGLTNIERLTVGGPNLTDNGLRYLRNMKNLDLLNIIGGKFTDKGLRHLEGLKSLRSLSIDAENDFSPAALQRLRKNLPNLVTLKVNEKGGGMGGYVGR